MTTFMSRLSAGIVIAAAAGAVGVAQHTAGPTGWSASNFDQSANRYSPLTQITPANVSTLAAGLEHPSQARRLLRQAARGRGDSHRDRQHDVCRVAVRRGDRARRHLRRGEVEISAAEQRHPGQARHRVLAGRGRPPGVDRLRVERRRALLDQRGERRAQRLVRRQGHRQYSRRRK